jgi:ABC-type transporter Mla MlaB component
MEITTTQAQGRVPVTVFHLAGELTSEDPLGSRVREAHEAGSRNILIDLSKVAYISSAGLRALHATFTLLRTESPEESDEAMSKGISAGTFTSPHLKLLSPSKHALEVLKTAGYDMFLEIHHDYEKALASF